MTYYYDKQIAKIIVQFMAIFSDMTVMTGVREDGERRVMTVPITYGSRDRVTAALLSDNTQNTMISAPQLTAYMNGISLAPDLRKGIGVERTGKYIPVGKTTQDIVSVKQLQPVPYRLQMELNIWASNDDQMRQILEPILILFDPILQIQKSDNPFDASIITSVELTGINNEENYPPGIDPRLLMRSLNFDIPIYLTAPLMWKQNIVEKVRLKLAVVDRIDSADQILQDPTAVIMDIIETLNNEIEIESPCDDFDKEL